MDLREVDPYREATLRPRGRGERGAVGDRDGADVDSPWPWWSATRAGLTGCPRLRLVTGIVHASTAGDRALVERLNRQPAGQRRALPRARRGGDLHPVEGDKAIVSIANTGPVISPELVHRLFEPVQRLDLRSCPDERSPYVGKSDLTHVDVFDELRDGVAHPL